MGQKHRRNHYMNKFRNNKFKKIIKKIDILFSFKINKQIILKFMHFKLIYNYS
jgi:hypothetical protein